MSRRKNNNRQKSGSCLGWIGKAFCAVFVFYLMMLGLMALLSLASNASNNNFIINIISIIISISTPVTFIMYGVDKFKAEFNKWRIREKTLLILGLCGGAYGAIVGMLFFRHKIRKSYFWAVNIVGAVIPAAVALLIIIYF